MWCQTVTILLVKFLSCFLSLDKYRNCLKFNIKFYFLALRCVFIYLKTFYLFYILFLNYYKRRELGQCTTVQSKCFIIGMRIEYGLTRTTLPFTITTACYFFHLLILVTLTDLYLLVTITDLFLI